MRRILMKRLPRDLKAGFGRYLALILCIALGLYMVIGVVGAAEIVITGSKNMRKDFCTQDGCFSVFLPLTDSDIEKLTEDGTQIVPEFYTDLVIDDETKVRMFKNRDKLDKLWLKEGRLAEDDGEAVLEQNFAKEHGIKVGDKFSAGGADFVITGLGCAPDYDACLASFADTAVQSEAFGLIFVTEEKYDEVRRTTAQKAEEYIYAYKLGDGVTDDDLKEAIKDLDFDYTTVEDKYYRETIDEIMESREELEDGVNELYDGSEELTDGLEELDSHSEELRDAADDLVGAYLDQASVSIVALGADTELTEENYEEELDRLAEAAKSEELIELKKAISSMIEFRDGINEYTEGAADAAEGSAEVTDGVGELRDGITEMLDEVYDIDLDNLTSFIAAKDNQRIEAAAGDKVMDKNVGLAAGVVVLILFGYVISVFVAHRVEEEASVIGTLYALGVKKNDLLGHYMTLPAIIALTGGIIGGSLGFSKLGIGMMGAETYDYFSIPAYEWIHPAYLVIYAVVMPPVIAVAVNALVINKKLSRTALSLIKNEQDASSYRQFTLKTTNFPRLFRIRQMIREVRSAAAVVLGMFVSLLVVMLGINCAVMCQAVKDDNVRDTQYEYMYFYKYPEEEPPEGGEAAYIETLSTDCYGYTLDVTVIGLDGKSKFFDAVPEKGKNKAVINNSMMQRFGYKKGDRITLTDMTNDMDHSFTVTDVVQYAPGFTIFMDKESMCELFGEEEDYYNVVYSAKELDIDEGRLYSITTKDDMRKSSGVFVEEMKPMVTMLITGGVIIFCVVMYLMIGVMIDRSEFGISLIKIFGYRPREVRRLYLHGNLIVVAVGALACIPLSKLCMDKLYPSFIANVACEMELGFSPLIYGALYLMVLAVYFVSSMLLTRKLNKITPAEVLKNRE